MAYGLFSLLEIQWGDAERILAALIDTLTKRRSEYQDFEQKFHRLIQWYERFRANELNDRLNGLTLQVTLDVLKNDIRNLLADKRRQVNDLLVQARLLQSQSADQFFKQKIDQLEQIMNTTEQYVEKRSVLLPSELRFQQCAVSIRIKKGEVTLKMLHDFEQGSQQILAWLDTVEGKLQKHQLTNDLPGFQQTMAVRTSHRSLIANRTFCNF